MSNKALCVFGIIAYIFSVLSSAEDLEGNYSAPIVLIVISAITMTIFRIMAAVRLWRGQKITSIVLIISSLVSLVYISAPTKLLDFLIFIWTISLLWAYVKYEKVLKESQGILESNSKSNY
jgi:hypothetical protein